MDNILTYDFNGAIIPAQKHESYGLALTTAAVAMGFGVTESNIREHKRKHEDEFVEGKHFTTRVSLTDAGLQREITLWSIDGIMLLGMLLRGARAKQFRVWATKVLVAEVEKMKKPTPERHVSAIDFMEASLRAIKEQEARISSVEDNVRQLEAKITTREEFDGFYTVAAWAALSKIKVVGVAAQKAGKACAKLCRERGIMPKFLPDTKYGKIMAYPEEILKEVII